MSSIQLTEQDSQRILLLKDKSSMLADDAVNIGIDAKKKFGQILNEWVKLIEEEKTLGSFTLPDSLVATYIRNELKARNAEEWLLTYVYKLLEPKYKQDKFNAYKDIEGYTGITSDDQSLQYMENITKTFLSDDKFDKLSPAEKQEYILGMNDALKRLKKVCNDRERHNNEMAERYDIPIKKIERAEKPPEYFWGQSATLDEIADWRDDAYTFYKYLQDAYDLCYQFKPTGEVDKTAAAEFRSYKENEWNNYKRFGIIVMEKLKTQWLKIVDEKNRETAKGWFKIGEDKYLNYGSHGAGVLNSIDIGKSILEYKDGEVYSHELDRPFTKEIVSDNTKGKLVVEAHKFSQGCKVENAINKWVKETHCDILITDPTEFMKKVTKDPNVRVISDIKEDSQ